MSCDGLLCGSGEKNCAVAIGFKVDTNVEALSCVMEIFDSCRGTLDWKLESFIDKFCGCAVGIGCLDYTDRKFRSETRFFAEFAEKNSSKCSDTVAIEKAELEIVVDKIVDDSISVAV